jgi:hypothetical protein
MVQNQTPSEGDRVRILDFEATRVKGIVGLEAEVVKVQDYILHLEMDNPLGNSILPSGRQYVIRKHVEVLP